MTDVSKAVKVWFVLIACSLTCSLLRMSSQGKLSSEFLTISRLCERENLVLADLAESLLHRGHSLVSLIFSLPFLIPIPMPGLSLVFGSVIMGASIAMMFNRKPWIPKRYLQKQISGALLSKVFDKCHKYALQMEKFVRPRGHWLFRRPWLNRLNGSLIFLSAFILALPLPPGTNFPPALCIILLSIGSLEEDGYCLALGYFFFLVFLSVFLALFVLATRL